MIPATSESASASSGASASASASASSTAGPPIVQLREVRFRWQAQAPLCLAIGDFVVGAGERVFLQGESGSGKSTLLSLIGGVTVAQSGRVEVLGADLSALSAAARDGLRAEHMGFVFQQFNLIPHLTARENILLACRFSPGRRARIAAAVSTPQAEAERLASHLDLAASVLDRPAAELSVGQQQRVAAARALIGRPALVVADEPTSALDAARQQGFIDLLLAECKAVGAALLFVSHDERLATHFDRTLSMREVNRAALAEMQPPDTPGSRPAPATRAQDGPRP